MTCYAATDTELGGQIDNLKVWVSANIYIDNG